MEPAATNKPWWPGPGSHAQWMAIHRGFSHFFQRNLSGSLAPHVWPQYVQLMVRWIVDDVFPNLWVIEQLLCSSFFGRPVLGSRWCLSQMGWSVDMKPFIHDSRMWCCTSGLAKMFIFCIVVDNLVFRISTTTVQFQSWANQGWKQTISGPFPLPSLT